MAPIRRKFDSIPRLRLTTRLFSPCAPAGRLPLSSHLKLGAPFDPDAAIGRNGITQLLGSMVKFRMIPPIPVVNPEDGPAGRGSFGVGVYFFMWVLGVPMSLLHRVSIYDVNRDLSAYSL